MGFFGAVKNKVRYAVMIDIGSGSVLASIIASNPTEPHPDIIWSKRVYTPLRNIGSLVESSKSVLTSFLNVLALLDSEGRKVLYEKTAQRKLSFLQVTIAAPWSYTTTKTISYDNNDEFEVTNILIEELLRSAAKQVEDDISKNEEINKLGLTVIARAPMKILANGYSIILTEKQTAKSIQIIEASAVAPDLFIAAIAESHEKMFPRAELVQYSFMMPFFYVLKEWNPPGTDYCLIDITYEATEVGIVRDGALKYSAHIPFGAFSLAREIAEVVSIPLEEAYGYLSQVDFSSFLALIPKAKQKEVEVVFSAYRDRLTALFKATGDNLAIPGKIYVHGNLLTETFFSEQIITAAAAATKTQHAVYSVSNELVTKLYSSENLETLKKSKQDSALLISAQFFHTNCHNNKFTHL